VRKTSARKVEIEGGDRKPVQILVSMDNPAGVFQIEQMLEKKIKASGIQDLFEVIALEEAIEIRRTERS
jgi:metal-dependent HD superfamily phosphatase/phosphodiesterase